MLPAANAVQSRYKIRVVSARSYHCLFMHNMLIRCAPAARTHLWCCTNPEPRNQHLCAGVHASVITRQSFRVRRFRVEDRPTEAELATFGRPDFTIFNAGAFPCNRYTSYMTSSSSVDVNLKVRPDAFATFVLSIAGGCVAALRRPSPHGCPSTTDASRRLEWLYQLGVPVTARPRQSGHAIVLCAFGLQAREMVILGSQYAGEMKKGIFTVMHYLMPKRGILSLHSGCNVGRDNDVSLFFGLSGARPSNMSPQSVRRHVRCCMAAEPARTDCDLPVHTQGHSFPLV
jgi:ATP-dependent phosphoenolpyruvate carboxykinase